jgi:cell division protein ZapD
MVTPPGSSGASTNYIELISTLLYRAHESDPHMNADDSGKQASLFPEAGHPVVYEQPLNERIRNCLRLEHLFIGIDSGMHGATAWDARNALVRMLEVSDFMIRTDIKGELVKELDREITTFNGLRNNPGVSPDALDKTVSAIGEVLTKLKAPDCQPGISIRNDELANQVKQRISIPGGTCSFDLPGLHFWLNIEPRVRAEHMAAWMKDLQIVEAATGTILKLIRSSSNPRRVTAKEGFYQQQIDSATPCQIVRVVVGPTADIFPEISGGKHRFTIRFYTQQGTANRPVPVKNDIEFELHCCGI